MQQGHYKLVRDEKAGWLMGMGDLVSIDAFIGLSTSIASK